MADCEHLILDKTYPSALVYEIKVLCLAPSKNIISFASTGGYISTEGVEEGLFHKDLEIIPKEEFLKKEIPRLERLAVIGQLGEGV